MAIQPIPPFVSPLGASTSGAPTREADKTDAPASVSSVEADSVTAAPQTVAGAQAAKPSRDQIDQAMNEVKRALAPVARNLQFSVDDATGRTIIKVIDASTNEVIRQMPSEELLAITKAIDSFSGLFVKQKA